MRSIAIAIALGTLVLGGWSTAANAASGTPSPDPSATATTSPSASPLPSTSATPPPVEAWIRVSPSRIAPGGTVHITGRCEAHGLGYLTSTAFVHDATHDFAGVGAVPLKADASGRYTADARIASTAAPGTHTVDARCGGGNAGSTTLTVLRAAPPTAVPAGSGGRAAPTGTGTWIAFATLTVLGFLLLVACAVRVVRVRRHRC